MVLIERQLPTAGTRRLLAKIVIFWVSITKLQLFHALEMQVSNLSTAQLENGVPFFNVNVYTSMKTQAFSRIEW